MYCYIKAKSATIKMLRRSWQTFIPPIMQRPKNERSILLGYKKSNLAKFSKPNIERNNFNNYCYYFIDYLIKK